MAVRVHVSLRNGSSVELLDQATPDESVLKVGNGIKEAFGTRLFGASETGDLVIVNAAEVTHVVISAE